MPHPPPTADRTRMHARSVQLGGFKRADGLWDIEARLNDMKDHDYPLSSGLRKRGEPVHDMSVRVTIDGRMNIVGASACIDAMPYESHCDRIAPDYSKLVGLNLFHGFRRAVKELFGNTRGCSHLTEMLMYLPTVALQSFASEVVDNEDTGHKPYQLDKCHALDSHSDTVQRYYPRWYRGQKTGQESSACNLNSKESA
ncbi:MAG: DUF2889 domain-containing protein [Betaproteobacteria bacterium]|nr:DUF2889 domain-containing protein [Betaproteobacteria bacterium]